MVLGRLLHYGVDAVLLSTVVAGIRRSSGFTYVPVLALCFSSDLRAVRRSFRPQTESIADPTIRSVAERYLGIGETIFDAVQATVVNSQYFKRDGQ